MSADAIPFSSFREYKRLYSKVVVTTDGLYKDGQVPDTYEGDTELVVEVVHEVVLCDSAGRLQRLVFDIPEALDKEKKKGGGYGIFAEGAEGDPPVAVENPYKTADYPETTGGATEPTKLYIRESTRIDAQNRLRADRMIELAGGWPAPNEA